MTKPEQWTKPEVEIRRSSDGTMWLENPMLLAECPANLVSWLHENADRCPDKSFLLQRDENGAWQGPTYAEARAAVNRLSNGLLAAGLPIGTPLAILSENSIDMAIVQLAAMQVGIPVVPISIAYSLRSATGLHIQHILKVTRAAMLVMSDASMHAARISNLDIPEIPLYAFSNSDAHPRVRAFAELRGASDRLSAEGQARFDAVAPDTLAKIQFTSGSTNMPKGVEVTHGMQVTNQMGIAQLWPFLGPDEVIVDWLPWNHTFGGNFVFNMILMHGGTFYIDHGNPTPAGIQTTIRNIVDVSPTLYFNVPRGYSALLSHIREHADRRDAFLKNLKFIFTAAAALDQATFAGLRTMATEVHGEPLPFLSGWGSTETAPAATLVYWEVQDARVIGLPMPGVCIKLVPDDTGKLELRVKGDSVTRGYYRNEEASQAAFDEDGFYRTGDAGGFLDPDDPVSGLVFDGRLAEDFKLSSGVWVQCGRLRNSINKLGQPFVLEIVVAAPNRDYLTALVFPNVPALRRRFPEDSEHAPEDAGFVRTPAVRDFFRAIFAEHNSAGSGSSTRFERCLILETPPRLEDNETTDKGYINQASVLARRAGDIERLYADSPDAGVIVLSKG